MNVFSLTCALFSSFLNISSFSFCFSSSCCFPSVFCAEHNLPQTLTMNFLTMMNEIKVLETLTHGYNETTSL